MMSSNYVYHQFGQPVYTDWQQPTTHTFDYMEWQQPYQSYDAQQPGFQQPQPPCVGSEWCGLPQTNQFGYHPCQPPPNRPPDPLDWTQPYQPYEYSEFGHLPPPPPRYTPDSEPNLSVAALVSQLERLTADVEQLVSRMNAKERLGDPHAAFSVPYMPPESCPLPQPTIATPAVLHHAPHHDSTSYFTPNSLQPHTLQQPPAQRSPPCSRDIRYGSIESLADDIDEHESVQSPQIHYDNIVSDQLLNRDHIGDEEAKNVIHSSVDVSGPIYGSKDGIYDSCNVVFARREPIHIMEHKRLDITMLSNKIDSFLLKEDEDGSIEEVMKKIIVCVYVVWHVGDVTIINHRSTFLDTDARLVPPCNPLQLMDRTSLPQFAGLETLGQPQTFHAGYQHGQQLYSHQISATSAVDQPFCTASDGAAPPLQEPDRKMGVFAKMESHLAITNRRMDSLRPPDFPEPGPPNSPPVWQQPTTGPLSGFNPPPQAQPPPVVQPLLLPPTSTCCSAVMPPAATAVPVLLKEAQYLSGEKVVGVIVASPHKEVRETKSMVNSSELFATLANDVICIVALGRKYGDGEEFTKVTEELGKELDVLLGSFDEGKFVRWLCLIKFVNGINGRVRRVARNINEFLEFVVREHVGERKKGEKERRERIMWMFGLRYRGMRDVALCLMISLLKLSLWTCLRLEVIQRSY